MDTTSTLLQPSHLSTYSLRPVALHLYFLVNLPIFSLPKLTQWEKVVNATNLKYTYFILLHY